MQKFAIAALAAALVAPSRQEPMTVPYTDIGSRIQVTGRYGPPIGTYLVLEGRRVGQAKHPSMSGPGDFSVERVNGHRLPQAIMTWVDEIAPLHAGTACKVTGYETASMTGVPEEVLRKESRPEPQQPWQFRVELVVLHATTG